jgi:hypothetical protein
MVSIRRLERIQRQEQVADFNHRHQPGQVCDVVLRQCALAAPLIDRVKHRVANVGEITHPFLTQPQVRDGALPFAAVAPTIVVLFRRSPGTFAIRRLNLILGMVSRFSEIRNALGGSVLSRTNQTRDDLGLIVQSHDVRNAEW